MRPTRRAWLYSALGAAMALPGYARFVEPGWLEVTRKPVPIGGLRSEVRILQLSDLHASDVVPFRQIAESVELGLREGPDIICLTGDYITRRIPKGEYSAVLRPLAEAVPTYAVFGNHDGGAWARRGGGYKDISAVRTVLEKAGVTCLHNDSRVVQAAGQKIRLTGVGDYWAHEVDVETAYANVPEEAGEPHILLAHNPDSRFDLVQRPWDLMLSGHTHGGQVVIPILDYAPAVPVIDPRFREGLVPFDGRMIHITRGVGNLHGVRFHCRPEVSLLTLVPEE